MLSVCFVQYFFNVNIIHNVDRTVSNVAELWGKNIYKKI